MRKKIPASLRLLEPVGDVLWFSNVPELVPTREISFHTVASNCCTFDLKIVLISRKLLKSRIVCFRDPPFIMSAKKLGGWFRKMAFFADVQYCI